MTHFHHHMDNSRSGKPNDSQLSKNNGDETALKRITPILAKVGVSPKQMKTLWKAVMKEFSPRFRMTHPLNDQILFNLDAETIDEDQTNQSFPDELLPPPPISEKFDWRKVLVHLDRKDILPPGGLLEVFKYFLSDSNFKLDLSLNRNDTQALLDHLKKIK
ncbi:MAG: hypothetical protein ACI9S8_002331 [Chlamydiales bacterium]|jgi:hypothetical protein